MQPSRVVGRYALFESLGSGGAAAVHLGVDPTQGTPVAIKRLHDTEQRRAAAVTRLLDEVRISKLIAHPNVVGVVEVVSDGEEMLAVMEYVHGDSFARLLAAAKQANVRVPAPIACAIVCDVLRGLHAAHEVKDHDGKPLSLVHRDVTPENVLVGEDGRARITDFGVAKAEGRLHVTRDGGIKGKIAYLAPEQVGGDVSSRTDIYAAGLVLWEALVGERPIQGETEAQMVAKVLAPNIPAPSTKFVAIPPALDAAIMRALSEAADKRFATAKEFADAIVAAAPVAQPAEVGAWVRSLASERLDRLAATIAAVSTPPPKPRSSRAAPLGIAMMFGAATLVVVAYLAWSHRASSVAHADVPSATATTSSPIAAASSAPDTPNVVAVAESATAEGTSSAAASRHPPGGRFVPKPKPTGAKSTKCDPPWYFDSQGIRRYDPSCMP